MLAQIQSIIWFVTSTSQPFMGPDHPEQNQRQAKDSKKKNHTRNYTKLK